MRFILSLLILFAFATPSIAAENNDGQKPALVKGSKSYQVRYSKPANTPESIEPAAGVETQLQKDGNQPAITSPSSDELKPSKMMKLHGKK